MKLNKLEIENKLLKQELKRQYEFWHSYSQMNELAQDKNVDEKNKMLNDMEKIINE